MISPSSGSVYINGYNVINDVGKIMNDVGLCPQENMLFPRLTARQQLEFFGKVIIKMLMFFDKLFLNSFLLFIKNPF